MVRVPAELLKQVFGRINSVWAMSRRQGSLHENIVTARGAYEAYVMY